LTTLGALTRPILRVALTMDVNQPTATQHGVIERLPQQITYLAFGQAF